MMTKFSRWMLYISSYSLLYVLLIFRVIGFRPYEKMNLVDTWIQIFSANKPLLLTLSFLFMVSTIWILLFKNWKNNTRYNKKIDKNISFEMVGFIFPYLISMSTITIDGFGVLINVVIYLVIGISFVYSEKIYFSPVFLLLGFKLYSNGVDHILTKKSIDSFNLAVEENLSGVEARELARNIFIIN